jgi:hypothetical protein
VFARKTALAVQLDKEFWRPGGSVLIRTGFTSVRFSLHPRQVGFAHAIHARPSQWLPLADLISKRMLKEIETEGE